MSKYLVTLTPTGKFFFGGDMRFGINGEKEEFSSYIIESLKMPQQTSLLGMMRFLLLSNSSLFDIAGNVITGGDEDVEELIGAGSFAVTTDGKSNTFGKIKSLGPCFVYNKDAKARYFRAAADSHFATIDWKNATTATINGKEVTMPILTLKDKNGNENPYTSKEYTENYFSTPFSQNCELVKKDELFIKDRRIGIDKDYGGKSKTNALYKQISYRLKDGFCFAFETEVDDEVKLEEYKELVSLGADSSIFIFEATVVTPPDVPLNGTTVVLLSDAYIPEEAEYKFSINKMRTFRFLHTANSKDASYYRINGKTTATTSKRYELYEAGSVFYFEDEKAKKEFCKILESREDFNLIGYNKYYVK